MASLFTLRTAIILSFSLRLLWLIFVDINPTSDPGVYDDFARSIVEGRGFAYSDGSLTAFWPVGTSAIYALIYSIVGYNYLFIEIFNLFIGISITYLSWHITKEFFGPSIAVITAFIIACWPLLIQFTTILASELIFIVLMLASIAIAINKNLETITQSLLFGLTIGIACYIRPIIFPLIFIFPFLKLIQGGDLKTCLKQVIPAFIIAAIIISPWSYRNTQLYGEFTVLSTNFGPNLWMGNNPDSVGAYMEMPNRDYQSEKDREKQLKTEAIDFIVNNPDQYFLLAIKRLAITFSRETIGIVWNETDLRSKVSDQTVQAMKIISTGYWYIVLMLACIGMALHLINNSWRGIFFTPLVLTLYFVSIPALTVGQDRYHIPLLPFIAAYCAYSLISFYNYRKSKY